MSLKVIGAGYGRTGTASLKVALEQLGIGPCYHMSEVMRNPEHIEYWIEASKGAPRWDDFLSPYAAVVDFPACSFYRELLEHQPNAKVILTVRDPERWFESVNETILSARLAAFVRDTPFGELNERTIWNRFDGRLEDRDHMIRCFNRHVDEVTAAIPADRLLVYEVKDGWEPLCSYLGCDVPDTPFPRINSREETAALLDMMLGEKPGDMNEARLADAASRLHGEQRT